MKYLGAFFALFGVTESVFIRARPKN